MFRREVNDQFVVEFKRVVLKNVSVDGFRRLLEFLYNGSISDADKFLTFEKNTAEHSLPERKHMASFWTGVGDLLATADRFNLKKLVLAHLQQVISENSCDKQCCAVCFNYWIFAQQHGLDVAQKNRTFGGETLDTWFNAIGPEPTYTIPMDFALMDKMLTKTGKL